MSHTERVEIKNLITVRYVQVRPVRQIQVRMCGSADIRSIIQL